MPDNLVTAPHVTLEYKTRHSLFRHSYRKALDDITFDVCRGETLGIVGGNGSGKSTLLRVLAGIFRPNAGRVTCHCESIMLLSLALGFEGELSGRDNALLSGVLLGGSRRLVEDKLDEIIAFAELEDQINDPLKTYSSGMRARLGFAVALMMRADLLLIDEVLSVGDIEFRRKAEKAMHDRLASDQTVVLVSHSPDQVKKLCDRVLWLNGGRSEMLGDAAEVVDAYVSSGQHAPKARPAKAVRSQ